MKSLNKYITRGGNKKCDKMCVKNKKKSRRFSRFLKCYKGQLLIKWKSIKSKQTN